LPTWLSVNKSLALQLNQVPLKLLLLLMMNKCVSCMLKILCKHTMKHFC
jgi:hypothetical protein